MDDDPISQFFDNEEEDVLYTALGLSKTATTADVTKAYRRLALLHHPDKHASATPAAQAASSKLFQQVGFAYAVLKDEVRRKRYDATGRTNEAGFLEEGEAKGWETYFEEVFDEVTKSKLDEMKKEYQGSPEELSDLLAAFETHKGALDVMLENIIFSSSSEEPRLIGLVNDAIARGDLKSNKTWEKTSKDGKAAKKRTREEGIEAGQAEEAAKEIGVWEEFYGSGKREPKKKGKKASAGDDEEGDVSALQALILKRSANAGSSFLDAMEAKYASAPSSSKPSSKKKAKREEPSPTEEMDDATFEKIQKEMKANRKAKAGPTPVSGKGKRAKK